MTHRFLELEASKIFDEMAGDRTGRKTLGASSLQRSRLSNITNLVNGSSWSNENELVKSVYGTSECQLRQVIGAASTFLYD